MTRYFFPASRAHHAYCMARDFGMEFERRFGKWDPEGLKHIEPTSTCRIYVHPDSLHLLEPRVGDFLAGRIGDAVCMRYVDLPDDETMGAGAALIRRGLRIIQRSGLAFHWPESEA